MAPLSDDNDHFRAFRDRGDPTALAALFDAQAPRLLLVAAHFARDAAEAEDLVQDTFLRAVKGASSFDESQPVGVWLTAILRNCARDRLRRRRSRPESELTPEHETLAESATGPAELVERTDLYESVVSVIDTIEEPFREVLLFRLVHQLEPTAIAHALGRAPGTVRMQLKRGLERLRDVLPASLTAVLASFALDGRGLSAVREAVLAAAASEVALTSTALAPVAPTSLVALVVMKKWLAVAVIAVLSLALWLAVEDSQPHVPFAADSTRTALASSDATAPATEPTPALAAIAEAESARSQVADASAPPSLVVSVVGSEDGQPRPGIGVFVSRVGGGELLRVVTDDAGEAQFTDGIANGEHTVGLDRQRGSLTAQVDGTTRISYELEPGVDVDGSVVDFHGHAVAGATVCLVDSERPQVLLDVARSDETGRFTIDSLDESSLLVACAAGTQRSLATRVSNEQQVVLRLGSLGHVLSGRVLAPNGAPVPHARVAVCSDTVARRVWAGAARSDIDVGELEYEGTVVTADALGRYTCSDVPAGSVVVIARPHERGGPLVGWAIGHVPVAGSLALDLKLAEGARIVGALLDTHGSPIRGVTVKSWLESSTVIGRFVDSWIVQSILDVPSVSPDAAGAFEITGLLPGLHTISVRFEGLHRGVLRADAQATNELLRSEIRLASGETAQLNPVVEAQLD